VKGRASVLTAWVCALFVGASIACAAGEGNSTVGDEAGAAQDMLTPAYYEALSGDGFREDVDRLIFYAREVVFRHPLADDVGQVPMYSIPANGTFGASKGPGKDVQHHPAIDLHVTGRLTTVNLYASHEGLVRTMRDAPKYRHAITITREVSDPEGNLLGSLVTVYGHVDLDLDEADGLLMDGQVVKAGDLISQHLYADTVGGPHLHFEIRYYRPDDDGSEEFYGGSGGPHASASFTEPSAGVWSYGFWDPDIGYGYADPRNHGVGE